MLLHVIVIVLVLEKFLLEDLKVLNRSRANADRFRLLSSSSAQQHQRRLSAFFSQSWLIMRSPRDRSDVGNFTVFEVQQPHLLDNDLLFALVLSLDCLVLNYSRLLCMFIVVA